MKFDVVMMWRGSDGWHTETCTINSECMGRDGLYVLSPGFEITCKPSAVEPGSLTELRQDVLSGAV